MLVSFSVSNFRSFSSEETFSLVASNRLAGSHEDHATSIPNSKENVLRTAVLYGANGSGKSNLFRALRYMRSMVLNPRKKNAGTGREAFRLSTEIGELSTFDLLFIAGKMLYRYGFKLGDEKIAEEWLVRVMGKREKILFERITNNEGKVIVEIQNLKESGDKLNALATVGGPQNQSFLASINANLESRDIGKELTSVLEWFKNLTMIAPDESFGLLGDTLVKDSGFLKFAGNFLKSSSTGIDHLEATKEEISEDQLRDMLPKDLVSRVLEDIRAEKDGLAVVSFGEGDELLVERGDQNHFYRIKIRAAHDNLVGTVTQIELKHESDGTRRLLNLLPALHHLRNSGAVYFIDEIDRSMHPELVWKFLELFLASCEGGQRQIIVTTHESNLLDLDLLRRDEIWFAEKDQSGSSRLYSLADFNVRKDLEIRKHYLQGRFGAVPFLGDLDRLLTQDCVSA